MENANWLEPKHKVYHHYIGKSLSSRHHRWKISVRLIELSILDHERHQTFYNQKNITSKKIGIID